MAPEPALNVVLPVSVTGAEPKVMAALLVSITPATLMALGAVAVRPPAKLSVSVAALPSTKLPVFKNVVAALAPVTCVWVPSSSTL